MELKEKTKAVQTVDPRHNLIELLKQESRFLIQIYSLESIETFERFLKSRKIKFTKGFTSDYKPNRNAISLLIDDGPICRISDKMILFSNKRNFSFIPYIFVLTLAERKKFIKNKILLEASKNSSVTSVMLNNPSPFYYTARNLSTAECVIVMCLIKTSNFKKLCDEIKMVEPAFDNIFKLKMELNWLCANGYCKKNGNNYKLMISNESARCVCSLINFEKIFN